MWITSQARNVTATPRPIRIAFLVPEVPTHELLDYIFNNCMSRWGGRRTPIIPSDGKSIKKEYLDLLNFWDADIIYSYAQLDPELRKQIGHCFAPSEIYEHEKDEADPRYNIKTNAKILGAASLVPLISRRSANRAQANPVLLDCESFAEVPRDFCVSFNFAERCFVGQSISPFATRLSFRPSSATKYAPRFKEPDEITYLNTVNELEVRVSKDASLLTMSKLSDVWSPYSEALTEFRSSWDDHLTVVVGDGIDDRLLFWNAIHRYKSVEFSYSYEVLRFSETRFDEGVPDWIKALVSPGRNWRHSQYDQSAQVELKSCTLSEGKLSKLAKEIAALPGVKCKSSSLESSSVFIPLGSSLERRANYTTERVKLSNWVKHENQEPADTIFSGNQFTLECVRPFHLKDVPRNALTVGAWANDLRIERAEDHSRADNIHHRWTFPRRLRLEQSVKIENYGDRKLDILPRLRPTEEGDLSIWESVAWKRPVITMPRDIESFLNAVAITHPNSIEFDCRNQFRFRPVSISDKGRDFIGVMRPFANLYEALAFMSNDFLAAIIQKLSPKMPECSPKRMRAMSSILENVKNNPDHDYSKHLLSKTAAWIQKDSKENSKISFKQISDLFPEVQKNN